MTKLTKKRQEAPAPDLVAEIDAEISELEARGTQLTGDARKCEREEREACDALDEAHANGQAEPEGLRALSHELRDRLGSLTAARVKVEAKTAAAKKRLAVAQADKAAALYVNALEHEREVAAKVEVAVLETLVPLLAELRAAGRETYGHGTACRRESAVQYRRREMILGRFLQTHVGGIGTIPRAGNTSRLEHLAEGYSLYFNPNKTWTGPGLVEGGEPAEVEA